MENAMNNEKLTDELLRLRRGEEKVKELMREGRMEEATQLLREMERFARDSKERYQERRLLYYQMYVPSAIVCLATWVLMIGSTVQKAGDETIMGLTKFNPYYVLSAFFGVLVIGRLADVITTLIGMDAGATELNPGLPPKVGFPTLMVGVLKEISVLGGLALFVYVSLVDGARVSDAIQLPEWLSKPHWLWGISGGLLMIPALMSFSAALSNTLAVSVGSPNSQALPSVWGAVVAGPLLVGIAAFILCTTDNQWNPLSTWFLGCWFMFSGEGVVLQMLARSSFAVRSVCLSGVLAIPAAILWRLFVL
jgi:hypothetical protein